MIPKRFIDEWKSYAPWQNDAQVEQDLVISRALVQIYSDDYLSQKLAFRGGTALHKLYIHENPRYSEDIDLVQIYAEPISTTIDKLRDVLSFLGVPRIKQKANNNTIVFHFESEIQPVVSLKLKVEINCREHFSILGYKKTPFSMESGWHSGNCNLTTYHFDELMGTKIRALFQRKKGRDLYDIYKCLISGKLDLNNVLHCFRKYMMFVVDYVPTQKQFLLNMEGKMQDKEFLADTVAILQPNEKFDAITAFNLLKSEIIEKL